MLQLKGGLENGAVAEDHYRFLNRRVIFHIVLHVGLLELLDQVAVHLVQAERATGLEHAMRDARHVRVVVRHQVEAENVLPRVKVDVVVAEDQVVAIVELFAPGDVDLAKVEAGSDELAQALSGDIGAAYVNIFQVLELFGQACDTLVLEIAAPEETNLAE